MKIGKVNVQGNANFADNIETIIYNQNFGVGRGEFGELKEAVKNLAAEQAAQLSAMSGQLIRADSEEQKQPLIQKMKTFLVENGIPIAQSLTASAIFELAKAAFGAG